MRKKARAIAVSKRKDNAQTAKLFVAGMLFLTFIVLLALSTPAKASIYGVFPQCNSPVVASWIKKRFNEAEEKNWQRGFDLSSVTGMHEHRTNKWKDSEIVRRYCNASAYFTNGTKRQVYYLLEDIGGFVGKNWSLTYCVSGLDPWNNHDAHCRSLR